MQRNKLGLEIDEEGAAISVMLDGEQRAPEEAAPPPRPPPAASKVPLRERLPRDLAASSDTSREIAARSLRDTLPPPAIPRASPGAGGGLSAPPPTNGSHGEGGGGH